MRHQLKPINATQVMLERAQDKTFTFAAVDTDSGSELIFDGIVGDSSDRLDSNSVQHWLAERKQAPIRLKVNSPGGLGADGIAIYNALLQHTPDVTADVMAMAGSAASVLIMAANTINVSPNSGIFVHRTWGLTVGNTHDMDDMREWLAGWDEAIARTYAARANVSVQQAMEWMDGKRDGTIFRGQDAVDVGLADNVLPLAGEPSPSAQGGQIVPADAVEAEKEAIDRRNRQMAMKRRLIELDSAASSS